MNYYCKVLKRSCLKDECGQYDPTNGNCRIYTWLGRYMHQPITLAGLGQFIKFVEDIRPEPEFNDNT